MEWVDARPYLGYVNAGRVAEIKPVLQIGGRRPTLFALSIEHKVYLGFSTWSGSPVLGEAEERHLLNQRLNDLLGTDLRRTEGWPPIPTSVMDEVQRLDGFLDAIDEIAQRAKSHVLP
jgi:hypothetical protein